MGRGFEGGMKKRFALGVGANAFGQIVTILTQLVSVPLFLSCWGVEVYGEWLILTAIPVYLSLCEFGFANTASNEMTTAVARGRNRYALGVYWSLWRGVSLISLFTAALALLVVLSLDMSTVFNLRELSSSVNEIMVLYFIQVVFVLQGQMLWPGFKCQGGYAYAALFSGGIRLLEFVFMVVALIVVGTPTAVALGCLLGRAIATVLTAIFMFKKYPWMLARSSYTSWGLLRKLSPSALAFMAIPISNMILIQGMTLLVGAVLGAAGVVVFNTTRTLSRVVYQVVDKFKDTLWPEITRLYGDNDIEAVKVLVGRLVQFNIWFVGAGIIFLAFTGDWIIGVWTRGGLDLELPFFYVILLSLYFGTLWNSLSVVLVAASKHRLIAYCCLSLSVLVLPIASLLMEDMSLLGAALALLGLDVLMLVIVWFKAASLIGIRPNDMLFSYLKFPVWVFKLVGGK